MSVLRLVMAISLDGIAAIPGQDRLPWDVPEDRAWFREQAAGRPVVGGTRTMAQLGRVLDRESRIIRDTSIVIVAGGPTYANALLAAGVIDEVYLTTIDVRVGAGLRLDVERIPGWSVTDVDRRVLYRSSTGIEYSREFYMRRRR